MKIKRTVKYPGGKEDSVDPQYSTHCLETNNQLRVGFEKGTVRKAVFELKNGCSIIYEPNEKDKT